MRDLYELTILTRDNWEDQRGYTLVCVHGPSYLPSDAAPEIANSKLYLSALLAQVACHVLGDALSDLRITPWHGQKSGGLDLWLGAPFSPASLESDRTRFEGISLEFTVPDKWVARCIELLKEYLTTVATTVERLSADLVVPSAAADAAPPGPGRGLEDRYTSTLAPRPAQAEGVAVDGK